MTERLDVEYHYLERWFPDIECDCKGLGPVAIGPSRGHFISCPKYQALERESGLFVSRVHAERARIDRAIK